MRGEWEQYIAAAYSADVDCPMEIYVDGDAIILKKYHPACLFCDESTDVITFNGKMICRSCLAKIQDEANK